MSIIFICDTFQIPKSSTSNSCVERPVRPAQYIVAHVLYHGVFTYRILILKLIVLHLIIS